MAPAIPDELRGPIAAAWLRIDPTIRRELVGSLMKIYAPRCLLNCWEWAERNIILMPEESRDNHGQYDSSLTPFVRRLMEFVTNPTEREFIIRKSSQLGFTLAYLIIICYVAATRPTHTFFAMDSANQAKKISARLKRLLTTNAALADTFVGDGEDDLQNLLLKLRGMMVMLSGSGSAGGFASNSFGLVILDELDLHAPDPKGGNTIDRARERLKKVQDSKLIAGGKPETWGGETNRNYLTGTRDLLFLPCPHCGHMQPLVFNTDRFRFAHCKDTTGAWDFTRVVNDTYYVCESELCQSQPHGGRINENDKPAMLRRYECRATNLGQDEDKPIPGRVSMWVNDLYSTDPQNSWGQLALRFIDAQNSPSKLTTFFCGGLADPQREKSTEVKKSDLHKLGGGYAYGCIPKAPAINPLTGSAAIFLTCDVQATEKKWGKYGLTATGEMYVIDHGITLGFHDLIGEADKPVWLGHEPPADEEELAALRESCIDTGRDYYAALRETYPDREFYTVSCGLIDEGHDTYVVRDFCASTADPAYGLPPRFFPSKGVGRANSTEIVTEIANKFRTTKTEDGEFITVYHYSDDDLKRELYIGRIGGFDAIAAGESTVPRLWFPAYADEDFLREFMQERRAQMRVRGRMRWGWIDPKGANDFGDTAKMALALWYILRPHYAPPVASTAA